MGKTPFKTPYKLKLPPLEFFIFSTNPFLSISIFSLFSIGVSSFRVCLLSGFIGWVGGVLSSLQISILFFLVNIFTLSIIS